VPFDANAWKGKNLRDASVRSRGRGLGLEIIHRAMCQVQYNPGTSLGNITIMKFGGATPQEGEVRHA
jgi:hypothetical protein